MDITAIFKAVLAPDQEHALERFEGLRLGDRLTGKVLRVEADGRLLIDLGKFRTLAQTDIQAQPGQTLQLKVEQLGTPLHLRLAQPTGDVPPKPLPLMALASLFTSAEQQQVAKAVARLVKQLPIRFQGQAPADVVPVLTEGRVAQTIAPPLAGSSLDPPEGVPVDGRVQAPLQQALVRLGALFGKQPSVDAPVQQWVDVLRTHLADNGHLFELRMSEVVERSALDTVDVAEGVLQKLVARDLKPQLLILKHFLGVLDDQAVAATGVGKREVILLRQTVDRLLTHVEQQQERGVQRSGEADTYQVFTHLLPVREHASPVRIKVYYPRKKSGAQGQGQHRIALLLEMDRLGPVRADIAMVGHVLSVRFFVQDQTIREAFDRHLHAVDEVLSQTFEQVDIATFVSKEKIAQFEGEDLTGTSIGRVDVQV